MRQTGRTAQQMLDAPQNAVYVWCNGRLKYPRHLAQELGRDDLQIVSPGWLESNRWIGLRPTGLVLDHAYLPDNMKQFNAIQLIRNRLPVNYCNNETI